MGYCVSRHLPSDELNCKEFYLDNGLSDLPPIHNATDIARGSIAIDIETDDQWFLNSVWEWERVYDEDEDTTVLAEYPVFTMPSAEYEYVDESSSLYLINLGETANIQVLTTFDRGTIEPAYETSGYRSGLPTAYIYSLGSEIITSNNSSTQDLTTINYTPLEESTQSLVCSVTYSAGEQPLDSLGDYCYDPLPSGIVVISGLSVQAIYPIFAGFSSDDALGIAPITDDSTVSNRFIVFEAEAEENINQTFAVPASQNLVGIKMMTLGGTWNWVTGTASTSLSTFEKSTETYILDIGGESRTVEYNVYTNAYNKNGARTIMLVLE